MTALPLATNAVAASATEADLKSFLVNQHDYLAGLFGIDGTAATARAALNVQTADNTKLPLSGGTMSGNITFSNAAMYLNHYDTDWGATRYIHSKGGDMGFLTSAGNWGFRNDNSGNCFVTGYCSAVGDVYSNSGGHVLSGKAGANANYNWALVYSGSAAQVFIRNNWGDGIYYLVANYNGQKLIFITTGSGISLNLGNTATGGVYVADVLTGPTTVAIYKLTKGA